MLDYYLFTFESSNKAMAAKFAIGDLEDMRIIPLIPEISAGCGLALKYSGSKLKDVEKSLREKKVEYSEIYLVSKGEIERLK
ncbi:DUF3343 domain-containing protein [Anaerosphaera multitolerans]|uniref:DUF3343 domain-containing protein n=1 Tax=Anaerosphaera multitolerans TaxID=2487351 RepID=A0A437S8S1_9FIRM|nr:DUF3343 domain-containing protein [Anaerosphaera multitolerans]RVU55500.1 DUF3343 domain-containing protein [Anaerosphaera multitolerans]